MKGLCICLIPFVQEHHLCLVGHQILQDPEDHIDKFKLLRNWGTILPSYFYLLKKVHLHQDQDHHGVL